MKITPAEVAHIAALANLEVPGGDVDELAEQLSRIVRYVEKLNELDTDGVEPTTQITRGQAPPPRDDEITEREGSGEAGRETGLFRVPRVIGGP
jgi:aspartyl-tRNA(Asn)/glutamyl-tRNA(Gln) amidotransferase subunit C